MFKFLRKLIFLAVILVVALLAVRNIVGVWMGENTLKKWTGSPVVVGSCSFALTEPILLLQDVVIRNDDKGYQELRAFRINSIEGVYEFSSLFQSEVHFKKLTLQMNQIVVVRNEKGGMNLRDLQGNMKRVNDRIKIRVDELILVVGEVVCVDEKASLSEPKTFKFGSKKHSFKNLRTPGEICGSIISLLDETLPKNSGFNIQGK